MKMPAQVIKKVTRIQREFLWGGVNGGKNLSSIKWKVVCQEKKNEGLGVRDIKAVNLSLLMKWRLLQRDDRAIWKEVLVAKYGDHILFDVELSNGPPPYFSSLWWKDICALENSVGSRRWLEEVVVRRIGNGELTQFWVDKWHGHSPLSVKFPRLFSLKLNKEVSVREMALDVEGDSCFGIFIGDVLFFNGKRTMLLNLWHYLRVWSSIVTRISGGGVCIRKVIFWSKRRLIRSLRRL
jgi:hypothetical protein